MFFIIFNRPFKLYFVLSTPLVKRAGTNKIFQTKKLIYINENNKVLLEDAIDSLKALVLRFKKVHILPVKAFCVINLGKISVRKGIL